ncbi:phosphotransferase family protein [Kutzneria sp. CA-103260]|uniref:phosphotransferase family protein n=1 Tax=Kutzneria sp. CA-103260 TaxID=2802641 RepID=UPI001BAE26BB|nr:aminoglycoside phosphotransferase family protein [Kutzneria sp. CA-103260]QUQ66418.1 Hygromycin-B 4-O-kinase [Kutzneria sp. CA-103260]
MIENFLRRRYGDRATTPSPLGAGEWSSAYALKLDGREVVARFGQHGEDYAKDRRMARHRSAALPVPEFVDSGETEDGYFAITRRAYGDFLDELDGDAMNAVLPATLAMLDEVRRIDVSDTTGYGPWRPDGSAPFATWADALLDIVNDEPGGRIHGWRAALESSPTGAGPFDEAAAALPELVADCPDRREIIHGDLLYRNVLVSGDRVTAVLDWGNSLHGDADYDLAWLLYWWPWYPAWRDIDIAGMIGRGPLLAYQVHIGLDAQAYCAHTGRWDLLARNAAQTLALIG